MCATMADIQSATAEIMRGKKKKKIERRNHGKNMMSASAMQGGHKKLTAGVVTSYNIGLEMERAYSGSGAS